MCVCVRFVLELQKVVRCRLGTENWTRVFGNNSQCSSPLSHPSSPKLYFFKPSVSFCGKATGNRALQKLYLGKGQDWKNWRVSSLWSRMQARVMTNEMRVGVSAWGSTFGSGSAHIGSGNVFYGRKLWSSQRSGEQGPARVSPREWGEEPDRPEV